MSWSGTVRCGHCYGSGHNKRSCPELTETLKKRALQEAANGETDGYWAGQYSRRTGLNADGTAAPKSAKPKQVRRCKYCNKVGHNRRTCPELRSAIADAVESCLQYRTNLLARLKELGMGVGTLVTTQRYGETCGYMVRDFSWGEINHFNGPSGGQVVLAEVLNTAQVSEWQRKHHFGVPSLEGEDNNYRYEIVGPVASEAVAAAVPGDWFDVPLMEAWAKNYFSERQSPNFYDNY